MKCNVIAEDACIASLDCNRITVSDTSGKEAGDILFGCSHLRQSSRFVLQRQFLKVHPAGFGLIYDFSIDKGPIYCPYCCN